MNLNHPPIQTGWGDSSRTSPILVWSVWFTNVWNVLNGSCVATSWTPVATSLTGSATLAGTYNRIGNLVHFIISITPVTTTASTAGTTTITLPVTAQEDTPCSAVNRTSFASLGNGVIAANTTTLYTPTWTASSGKVIISGTYRV